VVLGIAGERLLCLAFSLFESGIEGGLLCGICGHFGAVQEARIFLIELRLQHPQTVEL
jgi:hypothetical protein